MAFKPERLDHLIGESPQGGRRTFVYADDEHSLAEITALDFFLPGLGKLSLHDWILVSGSDGGGLVRVNELSSTSIDVTDAVLLGGSGYPADYTPPAFSYEYHHYNYTEAWSRSHDGGAGTEGQFREIVVDGAGHVWAAGADEVYGGTGTPNDNINSGGSGGGTWGNKIHFLAAQFNASTGADLLATRVGATGTYQRAYAAAYDPVNDLLYVGGRAGDNTPTVAGAYQTAFQGDAAPNTYYGTQDAFIFAINATTGALVYASYFGDAGSGDFFRDIKFNPWDGYLYAAYGRYGGGNPVSFSNKLVRINPDLSGIAAEWDPGNAGNTGDGQPSITIRGDTIYYQVTTTVAPSAGTIGGEYDTSFGSGTHGRYYIAKLGLSASGFTLEAATYLKDAGTAFVAGETHMIAVRPDGKLAVVCGNGSGGSLPVTGNAILSSRHSGSNGSLWFGVFDADLTTLEYGTYIDGQTANERTAPDNVRALSDGRIAIGCTTDSPNWPVTDGSTHPSGLGTHRGVPIILRPAEDPADGYEIEFTGYDVLGDTRTISEDDSAGSVYHGGIIDDAGSGAPGPYIAKLGRALATFSRPGTSTDAQFVPTTTGLGLTDEATVEYIGSIGLENAFTFLEQGGGGRVKCTINTNGSVTLRLEGAPGATSAAGVITTGRHKVRLSIDAAGQSHRCYVDDVLVVTETSAAPESFPAATNWFFCGNDNTSLTDWEYIRVWSSVEADGSAPAGLPVFTAIGNAATVNAHSNKTGSGSFS